MNTNHRIDMSIQQYAVAAYIQGTLSVKGVDISGATLCQITDDAIAYVNGFLVVTTYANVHRTMYNAGRAYADDAAQRTSANTTKGSAHA